MLGGWNMPARLTAAPPFAKPVTGSCQTENVMACCSRRKRGLSMDLRTSTAVIALLVTVCLATPAAADTLAADAIAFGARESVDAVDLSPDGKRVLYLTPGQGRKTVAVVGDLSSGQFSQVLSTDGNPESLDWCGFATPSRIICRVH